MAGRTEGTAINRLPLHIVAALSNTKADCSNSGLSSGQQKGFFCLCALLTQLWDVTVTFNEAKKEKEKVNISASFGLLPDKSCLTNSGSVSSAEAEAVYVRTDGAFGVGGWGGSEVTTAC